MDYYAILGMVATSFIAIMGFIITYRKAVRDNMKPMDELNKSIIELTASIKYLTQKLETQEQRVTKHGVEIDNVKNQVIDLEKRVSNIEFKVEQYHGDKV